MILGRFVKQPAEREAYAIEYEDDLARGDTIAPAPQIDVAQQGSGVDTAPLHIDAVDAASTRVTVWISGGTVGLVYKISVTASTASGRILQDEFILKIKDY